MEGWFGVFIAVAKRNSNISIFLGLVSLVVIAFLPFIHLHPGWGSRANLQEYGALGAWLQGALTPLLLAAAILSFWLQSESYKTQTKAFLDQTKTQNEANAIARRAFFIANLDRFTGHLAYRCYCALTNDTPPDITQDMTNRGVVLDIMRLRLVGDIREHDLPSHPKRGALQLEHMRKSRHYATLKKDLDSIFKLGNEPELLALFDNRLHQIRAGLREYTYLQTDPDDVGGAGPPD